MAYDVSHRGASFQNTFTRKTRELAALGFSLFWVPVRYMLALGLHANARRWKGDTPAHSHISATAHARLCIRVYLCPWVVLQILLHSLAHHV